MFGALFQAALKLCLAAMVKRTVLALEPATAAPPPVPSGSQRDHDYFRSECDRLQKMSLKQVLEAPSKTLKLCLAAMDNRAMLAGSQRDHDHMSERQRDRLEKMSLKELVETLPGTRVLDRTPHRTRRQRMHGWWQ